MTVLETHVMAAAAVAAAPHHIIDLRETATLPGTVQAAARQGDGEDVHPHPIPVRVTLAQASQT